MEVLKLGIATTGRILIVRIDYRDSGRLVPQGSRLCVRKDHVQRKSLSSVKSVVFSQ